LLHAFSLKKKKEQTNNSRSRFGLFIGRV